MRSLFRSLRAKFLRAVAAVRTIPSVTPEVRRSMTIGRPFSFLTDSRISSEAFAQETTNQWESNRHRSKTGKGNSSRERQRETERDRERQRETDRKTDRRTDRQ